MFIYIFICVNLSYLAFQAQSTDSISSDLTYSITHKTLGSSLTEKKLNESATNGQIHLLNKSISPTQEVQHHPCTEFVFPGSCQYQLPIPTDNPIVAFILIRLNQRKQSSIEHVNENAEPQVTFETKPTCNSTRLKPQTNYNAFEINIRIPTNCQQTSGLGEVAVTGTSSSGCAQYAHAPLGPENTSATTGTPTAGPEIIASSGTQAITGPEGSSNGISVISGSHGVAQGGNTGSKPVSGSPPYAGSYASAGSVEGGGTNSLTIFENTGSHQSGSIPGGVSIAGSHETSEVVSPAGATIGAVSSADSQVILGPEDSSNGISGISGAHGTAEGVLGGSLSGSEAPINVGSIISGGGGETGGIINPATFGNAEYHESGSIYGGSSIVESHGTNSAVSPGSSTGTISNAESHVILGPEGSNNGIPVIPRPHETAGGVIVGSMSGNDGPMSVGSLTSGGGGGTGGIINPATFGNAESHVPGGIQPFENAESHLSGSIHGGASIAGSHGPSEVLSPGGINTGSDANVESQMTSGPEGNGNGVSVISGPHEVSGGLIAGSLSGSEGPVNVGSNISGGAGGITNPATFGNAESHESGSIHGGSSVAGPHGTSEVVSPAGASTGAVSNEESQVILGPEGSSNGISGISGSHGTAGGVIGGSLSGSEAPVNSGSYASGGADGVSETSNTVTSENVVSHVSGITYGGSLMSQGISGSVSPGDAITGSLTNAESQVVLGPQGNTNGVSVISGSHGITQGSTAEGSPASGSHVNVESYESGGAGEMGENNNPSTFENAESHVSGGITGGMPMVAGSHGTNGVVSPVSANTNSGSNAESQVISGTEENSDAASGITGTTEGTNIGSVSESGSLINAGSFTSGTGEIVESTDTATYGSNSSSIYGSHETSGGVNHNGVSTASIENSESQVISRPEDSSNGGSSISGSQEAGNYANAGSVSASGSSVNVGSYTSGSSGVIDGTADTATFENGESHMPGNIPSGLSTSESHEASGAFSPENASTSTVSNAEFHFTSGSAWSNNGTSVISEFHETAEGATVGSYASGGINGTGNAAAFESPGAHTTGSNVGGLPITGPHETSDVVYPGAVSTGTASNSQHHEIWGPEDSSNVVSENMGSHGTVEGSSTGHFSGGAAPIHAGSFSSGGDGGVSGTASTNVFENAGSQSFGNTDGTSVDAETDSESQVIPGTSFNSPSGNNVSSVVPSNSGIHPLENGAAGVTSTIVSSTTWGSQTGIEGTEMENGGSSSTSATAAGTTSGSTVVGVNDYATCIRICQNSGRTWAFKES